MAHDTLLALVFLASFLVIVTISHMDSWSFRGVLTLAAVGLTVGMGMVLDVVDGF
jgi:hypothetical protein